MMINLAGSISFGYVSVVDNLVMLLRNNSKQISTIFSAENIFKV